jgi:AcrR family transcriptional regulator
MAIRRTVSVRTLREKQKSGAGKRSYHHGDLKNALLDAALNIIQRTGSCRFSLRELADSVRVTQTAVYRHFASLDELLSTLCLAGFDKLAKAETDSLTEVGDDPLERLRQSIATYVRFSTRNPAYFRIMFDSGVPMRAENLKRIQRSFNLLVKVVEECNAAGYLREGSPWDKAIATWAAMHGLSALVIGGQLGEIMQKPERMARFEKEVVLMIENGLLNAKNMRPKS